MLTPHGILKITDFGLVKVEEFSSDFILSVGEKTGRAGTPEYMAPEQWILASEATSRADIFSFGVILYELLTGRKPFRREEDEPVESFYIRLLQSGWAHEKLPQSVPEPLMSLVHGCLREKQEERPGSFACLETELLKLYREVAGIEYPREKVKDTILLAASLNNKGVSLYELRRRKDALKALTEALKIDPSYPAAVYNHSLLLWEKGEITDLEVTERLEAVKNNHPGSWRPLYLLGMAQIQRKDAEKAQSTLEEARNLAPDEGTVMRALEEVEWNKDTWPRCLRTLELEDGAEGMVLKEVVRKKTDAPTLKEYLDLYYYPNALFISTDGSRAILKREVWGNVGCIRLKEDKEIRLWDLKTGVCLRNLRRLAADDGRDQAVAEGRQLVGQGIAHLFRSLTGKLGILFRQNQFCYIRAGKNMDRVCGMVQPAPPPPLKGPGILTTAGTRFLHRPARP